MNAWNYDQNTYTELPMAITACYTTKMVHLYNFNIKMKVIKFA